jgi:hypothetical protein
MKIQSRAAIAAARKAAEEREDDRLRSGHADLQSESLKIRPEYVGSPDTNGDVVVKCNPKDGYLIAAAPNVERAGTSAGCPVGHPPG